MAKRAALLKDLDVERVDAVDDPAHGSKFLIMKAADARVLKEDIQKLADGAEELVAAIKSGDKAKIAIATAKVEGSLGTEVAKDGEAEDKSDSAAAGESDKEKPADAAVTDKPKGDVKEAAVDKAGMCPTCGAPVDAAGKYDKEDAADGGADESTEKKTEKAADKGKPFGGKKAPAFKDDEVKRSADGDEKLVAAIGAAVSKSIEPLMTALKGAPAVVAKSKETAPASRQAEGDDGQIEKRSVKKSGEGLFTDIVFGQK